MKGFFRKRNTGFRCPVCGAKTGTGPMAMSHLGKMQRHGCVLNPLLYETLNLEHYSCRRCGASDRERLYALYFKEYLPGQEEVRLLDIAPAAALSAMLRRRPEIRYRSADLFMKQVDDRGVDITDMGLYADASFDFFICSHILEHVPDDRRAMRELHRILRSGGAGIAMVPINLALTQTTEDPACTDEATRWRLFGQDDHIRAYSRTDFTGRLREAGFTVEELGEDHFGREAFDAAAILPGSVLYIVTK